MSLKGVVELAYFRIWKRRKENSSFPPLPLSHSYSTAHWPKSPRKKGDLFFWTLYLSESKQALLYVSLKSILLDTLVKVQPLAGSLAHQIVLNLTLRTSIAVN